MQAIEHLNKQLKSRAQTWTSGKKGSLQQFFRTSYELLAGKYVALGQAIKPSNFFNKLSGLPFGIETGFRFKEYDATKNMCYSCRGEKVEALQLLREHILQAKQPKEHIANFVHLLDENIYVPEVYRSNTTGGNPIPPTMAMKTELFQQKFLLFDPEKHICQRCFKHYQMSCMLLVETIEYENLSEACREAVQAVRKEASHVLVNLQLPRKKKNKKTK